MSDFETNRQEDPNELWKMINERDAIIAKLKTVGHWYDSVSGTYSDARQYHCACGFARHDKDKLDSHIAWEIAVLAHPKKAANLHDCKSHYDAYIPTHECSYCKRNQV